MRRYVVLAALLLSGVAAQELYIRGQTLRNPNQNVQISKKKSRPARDGKTGSFPVFISSSLGFKEARYMVRVDVNGAEMNLMLDTGSSELWVYSTDLQEHQKDLGREPDSVLYSPSKFPPPRLAKYDPFANIAYGDDSWLQGEWRRDPVTIGDFQVARQSIVASDYLSRHWLELKQSITLDGIIGFGGREAASAQDYGRERNSWFESLRPQLAEPLFALALSPKKGEGGSVDVGFLNDRNYEGKIEYIPSSRGNLYWQYKDPGMPSSDMGIVLDTGCIMTYWKDDEVKAYYEKHIPGAKIRSGVHLAPFDIGSAYEFPCETKITENFPMRIGKIQTVIEAKYMNQGPWDPKQPEICIGTVAPAGLFMHVILVGSAFFKGKYVVHKYEGDQPYIGIAWQPGHGPNSGRQEGGQGSGRKRKRV